MESNNNELIKSSSNQLIKTGDAIAITNKLLAKSNEQRIIDFLVRHPIFFNKNLSINYALSEKLIEKYKDNLDWGHNGLTRNENILWSIELVEKYRNKWAWLSVLQNSKWPWDKIDLDKEFKKYYPKTETWEVISRSKSLPWSIKFLKKYKEKWNWYILAKNESLPWTKDFFNSFIKLASEELEWEWIDNLKEYDPGDYTWVDNLSVCFVKNEKLPWSVDFIRKHKRYFRDINTNKNFPWTRELIKQRTKDGDYAIFYPLSENEKLHWTIELLTEYEKWWNWKELSSNKTLPWNAELIEKFIDKWDWNTLSEMPNIPWTIELIEKYKHKLNWKSKKKNEDGIIYWDNNLSQNVGLPWNIEFVEKYKDDWDWEMLSMNHGLPWSMELIEKYVTKWDWKRLSMNIGLPWSIELIEKYVKEWDWTSLSRNNGLPWSLELLEKFEVFLTEEINYNKALWEKVFKLNLNDEIIEKVFERINPR